MLHLNQMLHKTLFFVCCLFFLEELTVKTENLSIYGTLGTTFL